MNEPHDLKFVATPSVGESVTFNLTWKASNVETNSWEIINKPFCNPEEIGKRLQTALSGAFSALRYDELRYVGEPHRIELHRRAETVAETFVKNTFGLVITIPDFHRQNTPVEIEVEKNRVKPITEIGQKIDAKLEHDREMQKVFYERERDAAIQRKLIDSKNRQRILELEGKTDRNAAENEELVQRRAALAPTPFAPSGQETSSLANLTDPSIAADPDAFSANFLRTPSIGGGKPREEAAKVEGPIIIEGETGNNRQAQRRDGSDMAGGGNR